jgi:hypothetical protein
MLFQNKKYIPIEELTDKTTEEIIRNCYSIPFFMEVKK